MIPVRPDRVTSEEARGYLRCKNEEAYADVFTVHYPRRGASRREALIAWQQKGSTNSFVSLEVHRLTDTDARGSEPLYKDGELIGCATGGGFGWRLGTSLALGMVRPDLAGVGTELEISILGERHRATIIPEPPYDPENERLRA